ncbi:peptide synthetase [Seiridium cupressi]
MLLIDGHTGDGSFQQVLDWYPDLPKAIEQPIHELIQAQSRRRAGASAVCSWDGDLSYDELEDLSSRLASHILAHGVTAKDIVPLVFEKSKWMLVGLLAVLKAGGTFLMLDPSQPVGRLRTIVDQTGARLAMASSDCAGICQSLVDRTIVVDDASLTALTSVSKLPQVEPSSTAYTIFTSGSTGTPKGVLIEHAQLSSTSTYVGKRLGYGTESRVFQFASYAFDACITDIFATLVHGGTVCIPSEWDRNNGIIEAMNRMKVTHAKFTPSLAGNLAIENVPSLRTLMFGGESPPASLVEKWSSRLKLILVYGPTECCVICFTTDASAHQIALGEIGTPVASRGWIAKQENQQELATIGEVGELLIEGPLVGRGYLNDPEKTDRQFICNPAWMPDSFVASKETRLYRTGDLAKYLEDGRVCYVGRVDNQVKIRGQRLELEEVEKTLHKSLISRGLDHRLVVVEAVAFQGLTTKHLIAFLNMKDSSSFGSLIWELDGPITSASAQERKNFAEVVSQVKEEMSKLLPAYAVPSIWVPVKSVPYTISRKIDRKRLRTIAASLTVKELGTFASPPSEESSNDTAVIISEKESKLQKLWADVFDVPTNKIEPQDDFFSLGGDSVLAIKMIAAARSQGLDLSLQHVFKHPKLRNMALNVDILEGEDHNLTTPPPFSLLDQSWDLDLVRNEGSEQCSISVDTIEDIYPCSPMQEGLMALSMKDPGTYILQFVYQMPESVDLERLRAAWEAVAAQTQVMRTRFFDYNSNLLQAIVKEPLRWKVVEEDLAEFLVAEKGLKMSVGESMSRHAVVRQPHSQQKFLVWNVQHALVDGWSESDIVTLVEKAYSGDQSSLSEIPKFNRFIRYLGNQHIAASEKFWKEDLVGAPVPAFPPLPDASYVPKVQRSSRILHHFDSHADAEIEHKVKLFKRGSATPATMIQAAWFILMGLYSNTEDVITGVTLNGRAAPLPGIDQIPGPTVTTIPFRTRFTHEQPVSEFLEGIQTQYLNILPHVQFGLQNIRALGDDAVAACKFRTLLVVQSANRPQSHRKLLLGRSYSFPVMDFALVMECEVVEGNVEFRATFDHQILNEDQVRRMFQMMEAILQRISSHNPETTRVGDLLELSAKDTSEISYWHGRIAEQIAHQSHKEEGTTDKSNRPPSSPREKKLASIWKTLLQTEQIGAHDHFFHMGGGSVSAMRLVSMARREGLTLTVSEIFKWPVLSEMALVAKENVNTATVAPFSLLPKSKEAHLMRWQAAAQCHIDATDIEDLLPVHAMQLHYITGYPEAKRDINGPWDWQSQAIYALPRTVELDRFRNLWAEAIARHQALRTRAVLLGNTVYQAVLSPLLHWLSWQHSDNLEGYVQSDRRRRMSFGQELLRLAVVDDASSPTGRYFVVTMQHFIYDGFARHMLFKELETAYFSGFPDTMPPKMNQFIKYLVGADKEAALQYWTKYLSDVQTKPLLDVPEHCFEMDTNERTITTAVPKVSGTDATLPTIIEVVAGLVLAQKLDCADMILYSDRSGRNLPVEGIQDLMGPTTLFLPVRVRLDADETVPDLLHRAQQAQRDMLPHEHLGWLELREMAPFRPFYRHAVNMNINPNALSSYGRLGLQYQGSYASCDDPFGINVDLYDDKIEWAIYYDERFISAPVVDELLASFENLLGEITRAVESGSTVGELSRQALRRKE